MFWWRWKKGLTKWEAKQKVDRMYNQMSFRERERNWGLQKEDVQELVGRWVYGGDKIKWER